MNKWVSEERFEYKKEADIALSAIKEKRKNYQYRAIPHPEIRNTWILKRIK